MRTLPFLQINAHVDNEQGLFVLFDPFTHSDSRNKFLSVTIGPARNNFQSLRRLWKSRNKLPKEGCKKVLLRWRKQNLYFRFSSQKDRQKLWKPSALKQKVLFWFLYSSCELFLNVHLYPRWWTCEGVDVVWELSCRRLRDRYSCVGISKVDYGRSTDNTDKKMSLYYNRKGLILQVENNETYGFVVNAALSKP